MVDRPLCETCEWRFATRKGRCHTCYVYWRRTGRERPESLQLAHAKRVLERIELGVLVRSIRRGNERMAS